MAHLGPHLKVTSAPATHPTMRHKQLTEAAPRRYHRDGTSGEVPQGQEEVHQEAARVVVGKKAAAEEAAQAAA